MPQYNKLLDIQFERFQMMPVDLHFGLFWSASIPTMSWFEEVTSHNRDIKLRVILVYQVIGETEG